MHTINSDIVKSIRYSAELEGRKVSDGQWEAIVSMANKIIGDKKCLDCLEKTENSQ